MVLPGKCGRRLITDPAGKGLKELFVGTAASGVGSDDGDTVDWLTSARASALDLRNKLTSFFSAKPLGYRDGKAESSSRRYPGNIFGTKRSS